MMEPFTLSCFGNPSSHHVFSGPCRDAIRIARHHIQKLVNANKASEVVFTSCGTESDNRAIDIAISAHNDAVSRSSSLFKAPLPHIVTCAIEHLGCTIVFEAFGGERAHRVIYYPCR